jgi:hypothetical protein
MTMNDLADLRNDSVGVQTSVGELELFAQRFEDIGPFSKLPADDPPSQRLRAYLPRIASRGAQGGSGSRVAIDEATCLQLSDEDMERIAEAYLTLPSVRKIAEDQRARASSMERAVAEMSTTYLDRLLRADHDRQMEDPATTYAAFTQRFGAPLATALHDVERQAASLRQAAASLMAGHEAAAEARWAEHQASVELASSADSASAFPHRGDGPAGSADTGAGSALDTAAAQRNDRDAVIELTRSIGWISAQSAHLLAGLSESAAHFLKQFADTAEAAEAKTRRLLRIAVGAIVVAALLSACACMLIALSVRDRWEQQRLTREWQESLSQTLKANAAAQDQRLTEIGSTLRQLTVREQAVPSAAPAVPDTARTDAKDAAARHDNAKASSATHASKRKPTH